jgi:hypothetical protein
MQNRPTTLPLKQGESRAKHGRGSIKISCPYNQRSASQRSWTTVTGLVNVLPPAVSVTT